MEFEILGLAIRNTAKNTNKKNKGNRSRNPGGGWIGWRGTGMNELSNRAIIIILVMKHTRA